MVDIKQPIDYQISIPFDWRGVPGKLHVQIIENTDAKRWGDTLLTSHFNLKDNAADGFPNLLSRIEHPFEGYAALIGHIQFVRDVRPNSESRVFVDQFPAFKGMNTPFCVWGVLPQGFDSPFGQKNCDWTATTYLCTIVDSCLSKAVAKPLAAFKWGFVADVDGKVTQIKRPEQIEASFDSAERECLEKEFPEWKFE